MAKATDPIDEHYVYHDDSIHVLPAARKKIPPAIFASLLLVVTATYFIQSTLASNISINSDAPIQFGQGLVQTLACSGSTALTVTPTSTFLNSSGSGSFYFNSVRVAYIPLGCYGTKFTIRAYDNTGTPLAIFNSTSTSAVIIDNAGTFVLGTGTSGMSISRGSGTFTLTFNSPVALSSTVAKITIESSAPTCAVDGICLVGDTGPGGGAIFYVSTAGFNCGSGWTSTGSPSGDRCYYLEAAPTAGTNAWSDARYAWSANTSTLVTSDTAIGTGYKNTRAMLAQNSSAGYAGTLSQAYRGPNNKTDWSLPSKDELNQMCKWERGQAWTSNATPCNSIGGLNTGAGAAGFVDDYYWSSSEGAAGDAWLQYFDRGTQDYDGKANAYYVRPVRAF